jgi:hypothetical protein
LFTPAVLVPTVRAKPTPVSPEPSPTNDCAVTIPVFILIPLGRIVTPVPTLTPPVTDKVSVVLL